MSPQLQGRQVLQKGVESRFALHEHPEVFGHPASRAVPDIQVLWVRQRASFT